MKEELTFTKNERIALLFVSSCILIIQSFTIFLNPAIDTKPIEIVEISRDTLMPDFIDSHNVTHENDKNTLMIKKVNENETTERKNPIKSFDPNTIDSLQMIALGLKPYVIKNLIRYRNKGGKFLDCYQLMKIYGMDSSSYKKIESHCTITSTSSKMDNIDSLRININSADTTQLKMLKGIGSVYANRIVKFRNRIGGFHKKEQLKEVYGIDSILFQKITPYTYTDKKLIPLKINKCSTQELAHHSYVDWRMAKHIVAYRLQHGPFTSFEDLKKIETYEDSKYHRLLPYLDFDLTN